MLTSWSGGGYLLVMLVLCVKLFLLVGLCSITSLKADEVKRDKASDYTAYVQSRQAIALDDQLAGEMSAYRAKYQEFRNTLREKYPNGEDRIAAKEKWRADNQAWNQDWERRKKHLREIWNWGPEGKPGIPMRVEDLSSASGRVAAAIRKIRSEEKGTGRTAARIAHWMEKNKQLLVQAEAERTVPPAPDDNRQLTGTPEEVELTVARKKLGRIREALLGQGLDVLKAAMKNPGSKYSQQKEDVNIKAETLQKVNLQTEKKSIHQIYKP